MSHSFKSRAQPFTKRRSALCKPRARSGFHEGAYDFLHGLPKGQPDAQPELEGPTRNRRFDSTNCWSVVKLAVSLARCKCRYTFCPSTDESTGPKGAHGSMRSFRLHKSVSPQRTPPDRKSTRLNSSHLGISY